MTAIVRLLLILLFLPMRTPNPAILAVERQIVDSPIECAAGFDRFGNLAFTECGDDPYAYRVSQAQGLAVYNGTFTHNHPDNGWCWSLSVNDVYWAAWSSVKEVRAVSRFDGRLRVAVMRNPEVFRSISKGEVESRARTGVCTDTIWKELDLRYDFEYFVLEEVQ